MSSAGDHPQKFSFKAIVGNSKPVCGSFGVGPFTLSTIQKPIAKHACVGTSKLEKIERKIGHRTRHRGYQNCCSRLTVDAPLSRIQMRFDQSTLMSADAIW